MTASSNSALTYAKRRRNLLKLTKKDSDTLIITNRTDIRYLTGCTEGGHALLITPERSVIFTFRMFEHVIPDQAPGCEVIVPGVPLFTGLIRILTKNKNRRAIGYQGENLNIAQFELLQNAAGKRKLVDIKNAVKEVRAVKDEDEIKLISKCVTIAEKAFISLVAEGSKSLMKMSEKDIACELEYRMRRLGADRQGFPDNGIIVASGPNSASCHHVPTDRKPRKGEALLFDWGAELDAYRSDITRTVFMGSPSDQLKDIYSIVEESNAAGRLAVKAGVSCEKVSRAGWDVIRAAGHEDKIIHTLGHGLGMDVHELPGLTTGAGVLKTSRKLRSNMVITIEPGIYIPGTGGVRIEDDMVVRPGKSRCLNSLARSFDKAVI